MNIGEKIKFLRSENNLTQKELERLKLLLPNVSGQLPQSQITDKVYKRLIKSIYPKDSSNKFRR